MRAAIELVVNLLAVAAALAWFVYGVVRLKAQLHAVARDAALGAAAYQYLVQATRPNPLPAPPSLERGSAAQEDRPCNATDNTPDSMGVPPLPGARPSKSSTAAP